MNNPYTIRDYRSEDYPGLMSLWEATHLSNRARGDNNGTIRKTLEMGGRLILMLDGDRIIGSSWITSDGRRLYLHHFGILPEYQGRGLSHQLAGASLDFAREKGMQIKLEVHRNNVVARELYKKYGFGYLGDYDVYIIRELKNH